jgi:alkylation response protein AidB-like acyl-CoA dehydrogenase
MLALRHLFNTALQVGQIYEGTSNIQLQNIAYILQHDYKSA